MSLSSLPTRPALLYPAISVCASALLFYFSTGFYDYWLLTWIAPLPLCLYALQGRTAPTAALALAAYGFGALNQLGYLPLPVFIGTTLLNAAAFAACLLLFTMLVRRHCLTAAPWGFAAAWTAYEFIRSCFSSLGTFESLAYTQTHNLPLIQIASLTGIWGISFILMLIPASLAVMWHCRTDKNRLWRAPLPAACLLTAILLFGAYRLGMLPTAPAVTVGLAAATTTREERSSRDAATITASLQRYSRSIDDLAAAGARIAVLPEKIAYIPADTAQAAIALLSEAAVRNNITVIAGVSLESGALYNAALLFTPDGLPADAYHKQHLLHPYESGYTPGTALVLLPAATNGSAGVAICKDLDFHRPAMAYSRQGAGLLLVPALDFYTDGWLHARIAVLRGVEGNMAIVRAAQWGLLTVSDSRGRLLGAADGLQQSLLVCAVSPGSGRSFYSRTGDWFAWLCLAGTVLSFILLRQTKQ